MAKVWGSRFEETPSEEVEVFTASIDIDIRLAPYDIELSKAHAHMLCQVGLISPKEKDELCKGLSQTLDYLNSDKFCMDPSLEDIHTHIESFLVDLLGDTGRKIHTARSRNDQVATAFRMWCRDHLDRLKVTLQNLQNSLLIAAQNHQDVIMPAYTHWQRAQPMIASQHFLAHIERLERDIDRCITTRKRLNVMPLGSAAAVGTSLPIDRFITSEILGFLSPSRNSLDGTSDRDFVTDFAYVLTSIAQHLSSMAEEWIIWSTSEFGFVKIPDEFCTGSSIMPQKKNPDVLELIRGRTGRAVGALMQILTVTKALPLGYQRDLQEDKEPIFRSFDSVFSSLKLMSKLVKDLKLNRSMLANTLDQGYLDATSFMEYLIRRGRPMRSAHEKVGLLVKTAENLGLPLKNLPLESAYAIDPFLGDLLSEPSFKNSKDLTSCLDLPSYGSASLKSVQTQMVFWQEKLRDLPPKQLC